MIVPILVFPYISRTLGVDALGKYNFYSSLFGYCLLLSNFGISIYAIKEVGKIRNNLELVAKKYSQFISLNLVTSSIIFFLILLLLINPSLRQDYDIILIFSLSLLSGFIGPDWFFIAMENQKYLLLRNISLKILYVLLVLLLVKSSKDLNIFVLISILCTYGTSLLNFFVIKKIIPIRLNFDKSVFFLIGSLLYVFLLEIASRFIGLADVVILGFLSNDTDVGYYTMAQKVIVLSTSVLNITAITLLPRSSYYLKNDYDKFNDLTINTINMLLFISALLGILIFVGAVPIIDILGGKEFYPSIDVLRHLSISLLFAPITNTLIFQYLYPLNKVKAILIVLLFCIIMNILLNLSLIPSLGYRGTMFAYLISQLLLFLVLLFYDKKRVGKIVFSRNVVKIYKVVLFLYLTIIPLGKLCHMHFVVLSLLVLLLYFSLLFLLKEKMTLYVISIVKNRILRK
jgi:O-antigen/teichoic acid export membrane protein